MTYVMLFAEVTAPDKWINGHLLWLHGVRYRVQITLVRLISARSYLKSQNRESQISTMGLRMELKIWHQVMYIRYNIRFSCCLMSLMNKKNKHY